MQEAMIPEQQDPSSCDESETVAYVIYFHSTLRVPINPSHSNIEDNEVPDDIAIYTIHALHAEDDSSHSHSPLPPPVLNLRPHDLPQIMGFGCLGSSIYVIGGIWDFPSSNIGPSLDVYFLDTPRLASTEYPVGNRNSLAYLRKEPKLNAPKILPIVIALLGKLYVLPESFDPSYKEKHYPGACIEFLDPDSNEWAAVPEPILDPREFSTPHDYKVQSFDVVESCIILALVRGLVYVLDGNHPFEGWKKSSRLDWLPVLDTDWRAGGSEIVDGLWYPWFRVPSYYDGASYLVAYDLAPEKGPMEIIPVHRPRHGKGSRKIYSGERRVVDCGGGKAAIFSAGLSWQRSACTRLLLPEDIVETTVFWLTSLNSALYICMAMLSVSTNWFCWGGKKADSWHELIHTVVRWSNTSARIWHSSNLCFFLSGSGKGCRGITGTTGPRGRDSRRG